jgi:hypothetical protein
MDEQCMNFINMNEKWTSWMNSSIMMMATMLTMMLGMSYVTMESNKVFQDQWVARLYWFELVCGKIKHRKWSNARFTLNMKG